MTWESGLVALKDLFHQEWKADPKILELAAEYHNRCEAYDLTVCTGPTGPDGIMPVGARELGLINRNARIVRASIMEKAALAGISREDMHRAIANHLNGQA